MRGLKPASLPFSAAAIRAVLEPFDAARPLPTIAYRDPAVLAFEREAIFAKSWLCVGRESELSAPGAFVRAPLTDEGVLLVRGEDGAVRAFYNVCPHRGSPILSEPSGCVERLTCPYHGLSFHLDGSVAGAMKSNTGRLMPGLTPVRVGALGG